MRRLALLVVCMTAALPARAEEADHLSARDHFERGSEHEAAGRLEEALADYEAANDQRPAFRLHRHMGRVCEALGRREEALHHYHEFFERGGDEVEPRWRDAIGARIDALRAEIGGPWPPPRDGGDDTGAVDVAPVDDDPRTVAPAAPAGRRRVDRGWFWALFGLSAATLVGGGVLGGLALGAQHDFDALNTPERSAADDAALATIGERGRGLQVGTDILLFTGIAAAVATAALAFFADFRGGAGASDDDGTPRAQPRALALAALRGWGGL